MGELELAGLVPIGAGKAALHVAEEFGFEERFGEPGAVDGDEPALGSAGACVNLTGQEIFARPAFASDKDLRIACCGASGRHQDVLHQAGFADDDGAARGVGTRRG